MSTLSASEVTHLSTNHSNKAPKSFPLDQSRYHREYMSHKMGLQAWLNCAETNDASRYMAFILSGDEQLKTPYTSPTTLNDFQYCRGLLDAAPELIHNIKKLADCGVVWQELLFYWDEICESIDNQLFRTAQFIIDECHVAQRTQM